MRTPRDEMNRIERRYADEVIRPLCMAGQVVWWGFQPIKLQLGKACYYEPDFLLQMADLSLECHEIKDTWREKRKGKTASTRVGWEEDARVKIKAAASRYPFLRFIAMAHRKEIGVSKWDEEEIHPDGVVYVPTGVQA